MDMIRNRLERLFNKKLVRLFTVIILSMALTAIFTGAVLTKYSVVITDDGVQTIVYTDENQPDKILEDQQIKLSENDGFTFSGFTDNKADIIINRAKTVVVKADGREHSLQVIGGTVNDALKSVGVTVNDEDLVNVSLTQRVDCDMDITVNRVTHQTVQKKKAIPFNVISYPTQALAKGKTQTLSAGSDGVFTKTVAQTLQDGVVIEEKTTAEKTTKKPIPARVLVGDPNAPTSQLIPSSPIELDANGNPKHYKAKYNGKATAYSALGRPTKLKPGMVAMNYANFPKGTKLYIKTPNGSFVYGYSQVRDTGPAVRDGRILVDLFFSTYNESVLFGAKNVDVYVL